MIGAQASNYKGVETELEILHGMLPLALGTVLSVKSLLRTGGADNGRLPSTVRIPAPFGPITRRQDPADRLRDIVGRS